MALKHRVVQRFERRDRSTETVHELVTGAFNTWLQGKTSVPNHLDGRLQNIGAGYAASFQKVTVEGRGEALRWKFITGAAPHIYRSTITVLLEQNPREPSWVWFDVETDRENSHFSPPRLTGLLTRQLESSPRDRISGFTQGMRKVAAEDLGKFLDEVLEAEDRTVPAFVSGGRDWSLEDEEHVERALQPLYGIGTFWKLAPDAFDEFKGDGAHRNSPELLIGIPQVAWSG